jgi:AcrR family transcriptional regulator
MSGAVETIPSAPPGARDRILDTAYELFAHRGIRDVGVDELIERPGVAKATLYRHAEAAHRGRSMARLLIEQHR